MDTFLGFLVALIFGGLLLFVGAAFFMSNIGATDGSHIGYVTAVETNSFIATNMRAYIKTDLSSTQEDMYCVQDETVYGNLRALAVTGEQVVITFEHPLVEWVWNCSGEAAIITSVDVVKN